MQYEIKNRWDRSTIVTVEGKTLRLAIKAYCANERNSRRIANLSDANLRDANLRGLITLKDIDAQILKRIENGGALEMGNWHSCGTTHCRGGWAVVLASDGGRVLEAIYGTGTAAALIYAASRPTQRVPNFFATNEEALADIRKCAAEQTASESK